MNAEGIIGNCILVLCIVFFLVLALKVWLKSRKNVSGSMVYDSPAYHNDEPFDD